MNFLEKYPLPISGLILGLTALGNLLMSYSEILRNILGIVAGILLILFVLKFVFYPQQIKKELDNVLIASVIPTFPMALMLLSTYLISDFPTFAFIIWISGLVIHLLLIIWFSLKFVCQFNIKQVFPTWFIVYVGLTLVSVTGKYGMDNLGRVAFWFGLITYLILLCPVLYRIIKIKEMPEPALPTLVILAAPASLLLAGYINSFTEKNMTIIYLLMTLSLIFYIRVIIMLSRLLKLKFYPSYSGFTFPLVISATALKLTKEYFANYNHELYFLDFLLYFQVIVAVIITFYILIRYIQFLAP
ncbi:MAG: TDT family transporter [Peptococcales bacterium]|jgi:exfoliative toxin A/B